MTTELPDSGHPLHFSFDSTTVPQNAAEIAEIRSLLTSPPKTKSNGIWIIIFAVVFVMTSGQRNLMDLAILMAVLFVHEAGHLLGMKAYGFSDLKMFFIPFFGAAASGRKLGASSFEHAVVLLMGPLPGIILGTGLLITALIEPIPLLLDAGFSFTIINALNLLPVSPLDGGRLFERLVFNRRYWLEYLFRMLTIVGLVGLAFLLQAWIFGLIALFLLVGFGIHMRRARAGFALIARYGNLPNDPTELSDQDIEELIIGVHESMAGIKANAKGTATLRVQSIQELYDRASTEHASFGATLFCLSVWAIGWMLSLGNALVWVIGRQQMGLM